MKILMVNVFQNFMEFIVGNRKERDAWYDFDERRDREIMEKRLDAEIASASLAAEIESSI